MARRKKQTYAQQVAGMATIGMPAPVRSVATSRTGAWLLMLLVPVLVATGVLSISWAGGLPQFSFNRQRAEQVGQQVRQEMSVEAVRAAERLREYDQSRRR